MEFLGAVVVVMAKEPSVEVLAATALVLMECVILCLSILLPLLMFGMFLIMSGLSIVILACMVMASMICESSTSPPAGDSASPRGIGMLVLSVAAGATAKASSAEELAAAAQAFKEAQRKGRLMKGLIAGRSLVAPVLDGWHVRLAVGGR